MLKSLIKDSVEFLPSERGEIEMTFVNVTNVIDCVDYDRSIPDRIPSGKVNGFKKISFILEKVKNTSIFKVPELKTKRIFVSDEFRELVLKSKLKGLEFTEVWDSEITEETEREEEQKYEAMLADIERNKGQELDWNEAVKRVKSGKAMISGKWKIQDSKEGNLLI